MKSPTSSVGIIEPLGMWNGSKTNARRSNATRMAPPIDSVYSRAALLRAKERCLSSTASSASPPPRSGGGGGPPRRAGGPAPRGVGGGPRSPPPRQHGESRFRRVVVLPTPFPPLLAFFLLRGGLALRRVAPAVALGEHVL